MPIVKFPYGKDFLELNIPEERYAGTMLSKMHDYKPQKPSAELVLDAMEHPIGTPKLSVMAEGKKKVVIIASDHTRPVPSKIIIPPMLAEIRKGSPDADITILISTGCHRETTKEELIHKFGPEIVASEKIVVHDCDDTENLVYLGKLPSGGDLIINRLAAEADLLVAEGFIEPHFFAGFSGGRKSILPGVASRKTVIYNHNGQFIADEHSRTGIVDGNPIHNDMLYAARRANLAYIVNVVIDSEKKAIYAVAGDVDLAHRVGYEFLRSQCQVNAVPSEIVISTNGGYPLDQNIYQSVKGMTAAEACVRPGGAILMCAALSDGHGGEDFYRWFADRPDAKTVMEDIRNVPPESTHMDQWEAQVLARGMLKANCWMITGPENRHLVENMHLRWASDVDTALRQASDLLGGNASVTVIPDGVGVIVRK